MTIRPLASGEASAAQDTSRTYDSAAQPNLAIGDTSVPRLEQPNREDVLRGFSNVRSQVEACAQGRHGLVNAQVTIGGNGRVTHSLIEGAFVGTPQGSCMARALRTATFPPFAGASFKVLFPFSL